MLPWRQGRKDCLWIKIIKRKISIQAVSRGQRSSSSLWLQVIKIMHHNYLNLFQNHQLKTLSISKNLTKSNRKEYLEVSKLWTKWHKFHNKRNWALVSSYTEVYLSIFILNHSEPVDQKEFQTLPVFTCNVPKDSRKLVYFVTFQNKTDEIWTYFCYSWDKGIKCLP